MDATGELARPRKGSRRVAGSVVESGVALRPDRTRRRCGRPEEVRPRREPETGASHRAFRCRRRLALLRPKSGRRGGIVRDSPGLHPRRRGERSAADRPGRRAHRLAERGGLPPPATVRRIDPHPLRRGRNGLPDPASRGRSHRTHRREPGRYVHLEAHPRQPGPAPGGRPHRREQSHLRGRTGRRVETERPARGPHRPREIAGDLDDRPRPLGRRLRPAGHRHPALRAARRSRRAETELGRVRPGTVEDRHRAGPLHPHHGLHPRLLGREVHPARRARRGRVGPSGDIRVPARTHRRPVVEIGRHAHPPHRQRLAPEHARRAGHPDGADGPAADAADRRGEILLRQVRGQPAGVRSKGRQNRRAVPRPGRPPRCDARALHDAGSQRSADRAEGCAGVRSHAQARGERRREGRR